MSDKRKTDDTQPVVPVSESSSMLRLMRFMLLAVFVVAAIVVGAGFEPLSNLVAESFALLTNSRLPETSSRLAYSLTAPRDMTFAFNDESQTVELQWSGSDWRPDTPPDPSVVYVVSVFAADNARITSFDSKDESRTIGSISSYLGQRLKFIVKAEGSLRIGEHHYYFESEEAEFTWILPAATPTVTPTSTPTNTPTDTQLALPLLRLQPRRP